MRTVVFSAGPDLEHLVKLKTVHVKGDHAGWLVFPMRNEAGEALQDGPKAPLELARTLTLTLLLTLTMV